MLDINTLGPQNPCNSNQRNSKDPMTRAATKNEACGEQLFFGRKTSAAMLGVCTRLIDEAIKSKRLKAFRIGRRILIPREALMLFAKQVAA